MQWEPQFQGDTEVGWWVAAGGASSPGRCQGGWKASTGGPRACTRPSPGTRGKEGPGFETRSRAQGTRLGREAEGRGGQQQTKARRDAPQPRLPPRPPPPRRRPERAEPGPRAPPLRLGSARPEDRQNASGSEVKGERSKVEGGGSRPPAQPLVDLNQARRGSDVDADAIAAARQPERDAGRRLRHPAATRRKRDGRCHVTLRAGLLLRLTL